MPEQSGVDALAAIRARAPELPVLILSGFPEAHYATTLLRQGASGYLNKECEPEEIVTAIRTVARGRKYITPAVAELLADNLGGNADKPLHEQLSEREFQVFLRLAKGETIGQHVPHARDGKDEARIQQRPHVLRPQERPHPVKWVARAGMARMGPMG
jgi:DNA-binding NarL/FixJ family response regulator